MHTDRLLDKLEAFVVAAVKSLLNQPYRSPSTVAAYYGNHRHHTEQIEQHTKRLDAFEALSLGTESHNEDRTADNS